MEVGSPEWIEASLARLDDLERQRDEHEAALESVQDPLTLKQHNDALERLDAEIKTLYAQLEAVAEEDEDEDEAGGGEVASRATQGDDELSSPHPASIDPSLTGPPPAAAAAPIPAPAPAPAPAAADNPFASPSPAPDVVGGGFDAAPVGFDDDDLEPKGGGAKWAFVGVVVAAGLGVGGYFAWQNMQAQKQKDETKTDDAPTQVIKAAEVPDDTEAPPAAKGADATISPTASDGGDGGGGGGGGGSKKDEKKKKPLKLKGGSGDPLGGDPLG